LHPTPEVLRGKAAQVRREVRLSARQLAEAGEFDGAEFVRIVALRAFAARCFRPLSRVHPKVGSLRPLVARSDPVAPVVLIGETSARPADYAGLHLPQRIDQLFADAVDIGNARTLADPDAVVYDAAEVLDEVPVDLRG